MISALRTPAISLFILLGTSLAVFSFSSPAHRPVRRKPNYSPYTDY